MVTRPFKAVILIVLILSAVLVTISVYSKNENAKEADIINHSVCEGKSTTENRGIIRSDAGKEETVPAIPPSTSTPIKPTPSSSGSSGPSTSPNLNTPNLGSILGELVDKVLKSDENLEILVTEGMKEELDDYFDTKQLKSFNLSSEMEKAVAAEIKRICAETARSDRKTRKFLKKEYKKTIEEKKKKFKEDCEKGAMGKVKKMKKVKISEKSNELRLFESDSATNEFF